MTTINVRFPQIEDREEFNNFLILLSDLNAIYEITAMTSLDRYQESWFPTEVRPRRRSRLRPEDRPRISAASLQSPLDLVLGIPDEAIWTAVGTIVSGGLLAAIRFQKIITAGLDIRERKKLMSYREREAAARAEAAELENDRTRQSIRVLTVQADALEALRSQVLEPQAGADYVGRLVPEPVDIAVEVGTRTRVARRRLLEVSDEQKAEVLEDPIRRLIALSNDVVETTVQRADTSDTQSS
jgi:hypothetical protein